MQKTVSSALVTLWRKLIRATAMRPMHGYCRRLTCLATARWLTVVVFVLCFHAYSFAQPNRITGEIDDGQRFTLRGHLHRQAQSLYDRAGPIRI